MSRTHRTGTRIHTEELPYSPLFTCALQAHTPFSQCPEKQSQCETKNAAKPAGVWDTAAFPPFTFLLFPSFILPPLPVLPHSWLLLAVSPFDHSPPPIPAHTGSASKDSWAGRGLPTQKESERLKYSLQGLQTPALRARALCCSPNTT